MKTTIASIFFILFTESFCFSQPVSGEDEIQTFFSNGTKITGWFIDFNNSYSHLNGQSAHLPGFAGGIIMNRDFKIGIIGKSLTCHENYMKFESVLDEPVYLVGGHAGLLVESTPFDNNLFHVSFPLVIGGGGAEYISQKIYPEIEDEGEIDYSHIHMSSSAYWLVEPGVNLEVNLTGFMRFYAGFSYRWIMDLNLANTGSHSFNGGTYNFGLRFGKLK